MLPPHMLTTRNTTGEPVPLAAAPLLSGPAATQPQAAEAAALEIVYRDAHLIAIHKPPGLLVHRSPIDRHETRFAIQLLRDQIGQRVYPAHRLDKGTSGVLLFALDPDTAAAVGAHFSTRAVSKRYLAIVRGWPDDSGSIDHPLADPDDPYARGDSTAARPAITHYRCLARQELPVCVERYPQTRYALLELQPETGRRHQLRRHLKHIAHPIIGDATYGKGVHNRYFAQALACPRLLLHCAQLAFSHPLTGEPVVITTPPGDHFASLLHQWEWLPQIHPVCSGNDL